MRTKTVRVVRALMFEGKRMEVSDKPVDLPYVFALEMIAANKAQAIEDHSTKTAEQASQPEGTATEESTGEASKESGGRGGSGKKGGGKNA